MVPLKDNIDLECFLVTKHSWKGKYKRILAVGTAGISTYNPDKFDLTNRWYYSDIVAAAPNKTSNNVSALLLFKLINVKTEVQEKNLLLDF